MKVSSARSMKAVWIYVAASLRVPLVIRWCDCRIGVHVTTGAHALFRVVNRQATIGKLARGHMIQERYFHFLPDLGAQRGTGQTILDPAGRRPNRSVSLIAAFEITHHRKPLACIARKLLWAVFDRQDCSELAALAADFLDLRKCVRGATLLCHRGFRKRRQQAGQGYARCCHQHLVDEFAPAKSLRIAVFAAFFPMLFLLHVRSLLSSFLIVSR